jgi:hypothetical protein
MASALVSGTLAYVVLALIAAALSTGLRALGTHKQLL